MANIKQSKKSLAAAAKAADLDLVGAAAVVNEATTFQTYAIAAGAKWPVKQDDAYYVALRDGYSAAKKAVIAKGAATISAPIPAKAKGAAKAPKATAASTKKEAAPKVPKVELPEAVIAAIEAEVRSHTVRPCGCGCGVETRASYLPGHDAKLRSRLIQEAKAKLAPKSKAA